MVQAYAGAYIPGVKRSDWVFYGNVHSDWVSILPPPEPFRSLTLTQSIRNQVQDVSSPSVTANQSWDLLNETDLKNITLTGNVQTGVGNLTGWIVAANLTKSNLVPLNFYGIQSATINDTLQRTYWGTSRTVNLLNTTKPVPLFPGFTANIVVYWDRATGFLMDLNVTVSGSNFYSVSAKAWVGVTDTSFSPNPNRPEFMVSASPPSLVFPMGTYGTFELTLNNKGSVPANITVTSTVSPSGPTVTPTTRIVYLGPEVSSTLTIAVAAASPGNYAILAISKSGSTYQRVTVPLKVTPSKEPPPAEKAPGTILGIPPTEFYTITGALAAAAVGGAFLTLRRRRYSQAESLIARCSRHIWREIQHRKLRPPVGFRA